MFKMKDSTFLSTVGYAWLALFFVFLYMGIPLEKIGVPIICSTVCLSAALILKELRG